MTMTSPLRGPKRQKEAASPPLIFWHAARKPGGGGPHKQAGRQDTAELAFDSQKERENCKPRVVSRIK